MQRATSDRRAPATARDAHFAACDALLDRIEVDGRAGAETIDVGVAETQASTGQRPEVGIEPHGVDLEGLEQAEFSVGTGGECEPPNLDAGQSGRSEVLVRELAAQPGCGLLNSILDDRFQRIAAAPLAPGEEERTDRGEYHEPINALFA